MQLFNGRGSGRDNVCGIIRRRKENRDDRPADTLPQGTKHHQPPPAPLLDEVQPNERSAEVRQGVRSGHKPGCAGLLSHGLDKHVRQVVADDVDPRELLHRLGPHPKYQAKGGLGVSRLCRVLFKSDRLFDLLEVCNHDAGGRCSAVAFQRDHYRAGLGVTVLGDQPTGGFGEPDGEENDCQAEEELESEGEAPGEFRGEEAAAVYVLLVGNVGGRG